jgi:hypothetical protein
MSGGCHCHKKEDARERKKHLGRADLRGVEDVDVGRPCKNDDGAIEPPGELLRRNGFTERRKDGKGGHNVTNNDFLSFIIAINQKL